jgi:hypothetical protein
VREKGKIRTQIANLSWALGLALLLSVARPTQGQQPITPEIPRPAPAPSQPAPPPDDPRAHELAALYGFLQSHPEIAEQLRRDPSLVDNQQWVNNHPEFREFLQAHPELAQQFRQAPREFMEDEERYARYEDRDHQHWDSHQLAALDDFLNGHPEVAEQLRKDPSLIDNKQWVDSHPELRQFLQEHPELAQEFRQEPREFMQAEERYANYEDRHDHWTPQQLAVMNQFLESHPEIAEQLRKDPSLVDNQQWVNNHPQFREFLQVHPELAQEFRADPNAFMMAEDRYEDRNHPRPVNGEVGSFGDFLRAHATIGDALSKDPTLANNREFLNSNPELRDYLQAHPAMQQQLSANPQAVMTSPQLAASTSWKGEATMQTTKPDETMKPHQ